MLANILAMFFWIGVSNSQRNWLAKAISTRTVRHKLAARKESGVRAFDFYGRTAIADSLNALNLLMLQLCDSRSLLASKSWRSDHSDVSMRSPSSSHRRRSSSPSLTLKPSEMVHRIIESASDGDIDGVSGLMERLTLDDIGISPRRLGNVRGSWDYRCITKQRDFEVVVLIVPAGEAIPLHDHPGMTVVSKVLHGKLDVKSYNGTDTSQAVPLSMIDRIRGRGTTQLHCCTPSRQLVTSSCKVIRLGLVDGNIHSFQALENTAIFDVLTPPYDDSKGRFCSYYEERVNNDGSVTLEVVGYGR
uniref:Cysteine dioxygenase n=1 Tax=Karlodinium veneficum TaxID=407301 RepID=A7YXY4_KARVE|nr:conserved hypothetical protein [Karlodinium veneficum]